MTSTQAFVTTSANQAANETLSTFGDVLTSVRRPYIEIPYIIFAIIVGTFGNMLVIGAAVIESRLRFAVRALIANIAIADIIVSSIVLPTILSNIFKGYANSLEHASWLCSVLSFASLLSCQASINSLAFLGFERYCKVFANDKYKSYFSKRNTGIMLAISWLFGFFIDIPLITGWGGSGPLMGFDKDLIMCSWMDKEIAYNIFLAGFSVILPLIITSCLYIRIFIRFREIGSLRSRAQSIQSDISTSVTESRKSISPPPSSSVKSWQSDNGSLSSPSGRGDNVRTHHSRVNSFTSHHTAKMKRMVEREKVLHATIFTVLVFYTAFWVPYVLVSITPARIYPSFKRATGWLALTNSIINCFIYGILNQNFRRAYATVLVKFKQTMLRPVFSILVFCNLRRSPVSEDGSESDGVQHSVKFTV